MADPYGVSEDDLVFYTAEAVIAERGLNPEQAEALRWVVVKGNNLYLTGRAGTGKSWVGTAIRECLTSLGRPFASLAVQNATLSSIQGTTVHSYFQLKPDETEEEMTPLSGDSPKRELKILRRWEMLPVLEISVCRQPQEPT